MLDSTFALARAGAGGIYSAPGFPWGMRSAFTIFSFSGQTRMPAHASVDNLPNDSNGSNVPDDDRLELSAEDIEAAYTRALEAVEAVEQAVPELFDPDAEVSDDNGPEAAPTEAAAETGDAPASSQEASTTTVPAGNRDAEEAGSSHPTQPGDPVEHILQPQQVVEAALFVGGEPLTTKRLSKVLGGDSKGETVEQLISGLNERYRDEARPYEIRLGEGGYQLTLLSEFERIRDRVYGRNPKDVKLSQDALEVLAFVAYQQPVCVRQLEEAGKVNAAAVLRQLLRRQLVRLCRSEAGSEGVTYETTPRFLELFGLRSLDDLPLPEDLAMK